MKISQKKKCLGCKVYDGEWCGLGYKIGNYELLGVAFGYPKEPCPKPKTGKEYLTAHEIYHKRNIK